MFEWGVYGGYSSFYGIVIVKVVKKLLFFFLC